MNNGGRGRGNGRQANIRRNVQARQAREIMQRMMPGLLDDDDEEEEEDEQEVERQRRQRIREANRFILAERGEEDQLESDDDMNDDEREARLMPRRRVAPPRPERLEAQQRVRDRDAERDAEEQDRQVQRRQQQMQAAQAQPQVRQGAGAPRGGPPRPIADPSGNIRFANRQLRSAVSWMFTLHLTANSRRVNYFPDPPTAANLDVDDHGIYIRPYVVPTVNQLQPRPHAPVYIIYQLEQGNNGAVDHNNQRIHGNGMHYQGYMEFGAKVSALEICAVMGWTEAHGWDMRDVWLEPRSGRREDAIRYVTKDDTAVDVDPVVRDFAHGVISAADVQDLVEQFENGDEQAPPLAPMRPTSGEPRPADAAEISKAVEAMINEGASYLDIFKAHPAYALSHPTGIKAAILAVSDAQGGVLAHRDVKTFVFWGDSRTGKTRRIAELEGNENLVMDKAKVYIKNRTEQYYQHYTNQEVLVLDEFTGSLEGKLTIAEFCAMLDGSNLSLPIKYESPRFAKWTRVYITSNIPPRRWFPNATPEQIDAMYNRLNTGGIIKFVNTGKPASMAAHQAELDSQTYLQDRPQVIFKNSTEW